MAVTPTIRHFVGRSIAEFTFSTMVYTCTKYHAFMKRCTIARFFAGIFPTRTHFVLEMNTFGPGDERVSHWRWALTGGERTQIACSNFTHTHIHTHTHTHTHTASYQQLPNRTYVECTICSMPEISEKKTQESTIENAMHLWRQFHGRSSPVVAHTPPQMRKGTHPVVE